MRSNGILLAVLVLPALAGCSDQGFTAFDQVDVFRQNPPDQVDVLLVVDDSCSMQPYQEALGRNFDQFIRWFIEADVDYQIGVVTTDMSATNPQRGRISQPYITADTANASAEFSRIVNVGIEGSGYEMGLEAARVALQDEVSNAGFLRDDASLSVIVVSDEEDASPDGVNTYINDFYAVKGLRNRTVFNASALVTIDTALCPGDPDVAQSTTGTRYIDVAQQTNGVVADMCVGVNDDEAFGNIVFDLSLTSSRLRNVYYLSEEPNLETLQVSVDDEIVPCETGQWTFDFVLDEALGEDRPAIRFADEHLPPVGAQIAVRYFPGGADPLAFCPELGSAGGDTDTAGQE